MENALTITMGSASLVSSADMIILCKSAEKHIVEQVTVEKDTQKPVGIIS